jgi:hypothetical protein
MTAIIEGSEFKPAEMGKIIQDLSTLTSFIKCHTPTGHFFGCLPHFVQLNFQGKLSHICAIPTEPATSDVTASSSTPLLKAILCYIPS